MDFRRRPPVICSVIKVAQEKNNLIYSIFCSALPNNPIGRQNLLQYQNLMQD
jgi:hypothetical protein